MATRSPSFALRSRHALTRTLLLCAAMTSVMACSEAVEIKPFAQTPPPQVDSTVGIRFVQLFSPGSKPQLAIDPLAPGFEQVVRLNVTVRPDHLPGGALSAELPIEVLARVAVVSVDGEKVAFSQTIESISGAPHDVLKAAIGTMTHNLIVDPGAARQAVAQEDAEPLSDAAKLLHEWLRQSALFFPTEAVGEGAIWDIELPISDAIIDGWSALATLSKSSAKNAETQIAFRPYDPNFSLILDPGTEPRSPLRYQFTEGSVQEIVAETTFNTQFGTNSSLELPTLQIRLRASVHKVDGENATLRYEILSAELAASKDDKTPQQAQRSINPALETLVGLTLEGVFSQRGELVRALAPTPGDPLLVSTQKLSGSLDGVAPFAQFIANAPAASSLPAESTKIIEALEAAGVAPSPQAIKTLSETLQANTIGLQPLLDLIDQSPESKALPPKTQAFLTSLRALVASSMGKRLSAETLKFIENLQMNLQGATALLPEQPLGLGAKWLVRTPLRSSALQIRRTATYNLTQRDGDTALISFEARQTAPSQLLERKGIRNQDVTMQLDGFSAKESGNFTFNFKEISPLLENTLRLNLQLTPVGSDQSIYSSSEIQVRLRTP